MAGQRETEKRLEDILETRRPERRLVGRILTYWHDMRGDRPIPTVTDIEGEGLGEDWAYCFLIDVRPSFSVPAMVYMGAVIQQFAGILISGRINVILDVMDVAQRKITLARAERAPVLVEEEFPFSDTERLLTRAVFLPLSGEKDDHVSFVLGAANGKVAPQVPGL